MSDTILAGLGRLLKPRHIAVAGGRVARIVVAESERMGFAGPIWPIHPEAAEIGGRKAFRSVADLPEAPDAVFLATPAAPTIDLVAALAERGAGAAVVYAAGFAEAGGAGIALEERLVAAAAGMPIVGPNCLGVLNLVDGAMLWPDAHGAGPAERGVAILTQSGNIALNITMQRRSLPIAWVISMGNKAVGDQGHYIEALLADDRVTAIGLHIEAIDDLALFSRAALLALDKGVPIVVLKTGRSTLGAEIAMSHTSSLAGPDALYDALFERFGMARARDIGGFVETLKLMHATGGLPGRRIASMSCSGGEAALVADLAADRGLEFPPLPADNAARLREVLTERVHVANPLDYHTYIWGDRAACTATFTAMLGAGFDLSLLILDQPRLDRGNTVDQGFDVARESLISAVGTTGARAAVVASLPENMRESDAERLFAAGIVPMQGITETLDAIRGAAAFTTARGRREALAPLVNAGTIDLTSAVTLGESEAKRLLSRHGLDVPASRLARPVEAAAVAAAIGFPVAVKIASETIAHKSDVGGVRLGLRSRAEVMQAVESMAHLGDRFLIERMVEGAVAELLIGVVRDPQFGPTLTLGAGGVMVELLKDSRQLLLPVTPDEVRSALLSLRMAPLLTGFRGKPAGDIQAAVKAVMAVADFAMAHRDRLVELDVNPLFVLPRGRGAVAADALIRMAPP